MASLYAPAHARASKLYKCKHPEKARESYKKHRAKYGDVYQLARRENLRKRYHAHPEEFTDKAKVRNKRLKQMPVDELLYLVGYYDNSTEVK